MTASQRCFYLEVEKSLTKGLYIDIDGNISYVFTYLYKVLRQLKKIGAKAIYENLVYVSEMYADYPTLHQYCLFWAGECLLYERLYERFILESETQSFHKGTYFPGLRLNLKRILGWESGWEVDLVKFYGSRTSEFIKNNEALYLDHLIPHIQNYVKEKGGWPKFFKWLSENEKPYPHLLFSGSMRDKPKLPDKVFSLVGKHAELQPELKKICKVAENNTRTHLGLPAIGEGWISETELFKFLQTHFHQTEVVQHGRPHFLGRQHYDIWMPQWKVAVEFHGRQHFEPVVFFGGDEAYAANIVRDQRKIQLSTENNVHLFVVTHGYDLADLISRIAATRENVDFSLGSVLAQT